MRERDCSERERGCKRWGQIEGNLCNVACTREEQTGTQLSEEARREQNNSSLSLALSIPPPSTSLYLSRSPLLCQKAKLSTTVLHGMVTQGRAGNEPQRGRDKEVQPADEASSRKSRERQNFFTYI